MNRRIQFFLICLAALLFLRQPARADSPYVVDVWTTGDKLPENSVLAVRQAHDGWLWLGTQNGLARFDGDTFTPFNINNTPGLPGNIVVFLFEDSRSNLWVGTDNGGLGMVQNGVLKNFNVGGSAKIIATYEDENHDTWFTAWDGHVLRAHNGEVDTQPVVAPAFRDTLYSLAFNLVVPDGKQSWHLNLNNNHVERWVGNRLLSDYGHCPWSPILRGLPLPAVQSSIYIDTTVTAACTDPDGNLVVGTYGQGVYWMGGQGTWRHIVTGGKSLQDFVKSVCFDHEGNLWVGTDGGGLYRVRNKHFEVPENLPTGVAKSVAEDAAGGVWVSYNANGIAYASSNNATVYSAGQGNNPWSVLVDRKQNIWAGTSSEGLFRFRNGRFDPVPIVSQIGLQIFALFEGRDGTVWAGGRRGLAKFDGQAWKFYTVADGLPAGAIHALAEDAKGGLFIGVDGSGLYCLRDGKISAVDSPVKDIACLLVDTNDVLWVGTAGHGLARLAQGHWTTYGAGDGLAGDDIGYLIEDDSGILWAGSYEGLMRIEKKSLEDFAAGNAASISCRIFLTRECIGAQPAAARMRDGRLWFPTIEGPVVVDAANLKLNTNPPPVVIESVAVDRVKRDTNRLSSIVNGAVTLSPGDEQLDIRFSSLDFSAPKGVRQAVQFQYKLGNYDKGWTDVGESRAAHFPKLPPGSYTFQVRACNEDGVWNETGATLAITVEPPFWRTPGFIVISSLVFIGLIAGIVYLISTARLKRELRAAQQKELIERERARIARDLHDQLGANLTQVTLLGEMAEADKDLPEEVEQHAQQICATARESTHALDEIVWAVNPANDTLEGLANYACKYAQDYFALAGLSYRAELPPNLPHMLILPEVRHNVFLAFKEAVNNVVKHAKATEARVKLQLEPGRFILSVADNGRGPGDVASKTLRNGMKNMRKRLADIRGEFDIAPGPGGGTVVELRVPLALK